MYYVDLTLKFLLVKIRWLWTDWLCCV